MCIRDRPKGEPLRAMTRALGASPEDALGLIAQTDNDLAGALSIAPQQPRGEPGYRPIPYADALERIIEELPGLVDADGRPVALRLTGADSDDRAHLFRSDAAQRSDLIARR